MKTIDINQVAANLGVNAMDVQAELAGHPELYNGCENAEIFLAFRMAHLSQAAKNKAALLAKLIA